MPDCPFISYIRIPAKIDTLYNKEYKYEAWTPLHNKARSLVTCAGQISRSWMLVFGSTARFIFSMGNQPGFGPKLLPIVKYIRGIITGYNSKPFTSFKE